jgi:hypothetical protein
MGEPLMSKYSSANTLGPLSIGRPEPSKIRPNMSSETGIFKLSPVNSTVVLRTSTPEVPSKTYPMQGAEHNSDCLLK